MLFGNMDHQRQLFCMLAADYCFELCLHGLHMAYSNGPKYPHSKEYGFDTRHEGHSRSLISV